MNIVLNGYYKTMGIINSYLISPLHMMSLLTICWLVMSIFFANEAYAGSTGEDEFSPLLSKFEALSEGSFMKIVALASIFIGVVKAITSAAFGVLGICIAVALFCQFGPGIVVDLVGAVV